MSKYQSRKTQCRAGHLHDSKKEAGRCNELHMLQKAGEIYELKTQVKYVLIPAQYAESDEVYKTRSKRGQPKRGRLIERECAYYADFDYIDSKGRHIVEDVKGIKTDVYKIKKKLMLERYGIQIREV